MLSVWSNHTLRSSSAVLRQQSRSITQIATLRSWQLDEFQKQAFEPEIPAVLPRSADNTPAACARWFETPEVLSTDDSSSRLEKVQLSREYFAPYQSISVPLEITQRSSQDSTDVVFEKIEAPLKLLLDSLSSADEKSRSIYLAQHDLRDLPERLQEDLRTPSLVQAAGKGDIYSSSLWLGKAPTYTPLHRDPNPNLFVQLAGVKSIRLFRPEVGSSVFDLVQRLLQQEGQTSISHSTALRGDEMMQGPERQLLHDLVWPGTSPSHMQYTDAILQHAQDATLQSGDALFIPKGWWHSVVGEGEGITASANWWFR